MSEVIIGLISDTHGLLREEVKKLLKGCNFIIHAGDIGDLQIISSLEEIAKVYPVRGNVDRGELLKVVPKTQFLEVNGRNIYVVHQVQDIDIDLEGSGIDIVVYGHSHRPKVEEKEGIIYINPGASGPKRFKLPLSIGKLIINDEGMFSNIIYI